MKEEVIAHIEILNTAMLVDEKHQRAGRKFSKDRTEELKKGFTQTSIQPKGHLQQYQMKQPEYCRDGSVIISWENTNPGVKVQIFELEVNEAGQETQKVNIKYESGDENNGIYSYRADPFLFFPKRRYSIRVHAKSFDSRWLPDRWSDIMIVCTPRSKGPPQKPSSCPEIQTYFCSDNGSSDGAVNSAKLILPYPSKEERNGKPLEKMVLYYSDQNSTRSSSIDITDFVDEAKADQQITTEVHGLNLDQLNTFYFTWVNKCGESEHSDPLIIHKEDAIPGPPTLIRESSKKSYKFIKIRWEKPEINMLLLLIIMKYT